MKDYYYEMFVSSENALEMFKNLAFELGISCIEERDGGFIIRDENELDDVEFAMSEFKKRLEQSLKSHVDLKINISKEKNVDWINEYKKGVKPIQVGKFYVRPSWEETNENGFIDLIIDPALAFGSGHHESTNMCLKILSQYAQGDKTMLDVGCGSGILSIAGEKLGMRVSSCDTDEQALLATYENTVKNGVSLENTWVGSVGDAEEKYDFVVANIIADVILILQNDLKSRVKDGGLLILSGILERYKDRIKDAFKEFEILEIKQQNEWLSFVLKNKDGHER